MRLVNQDGRLGLSTPDGVVDVERASAEAFAADPQAIYERWDEFHAWHAGAAATERHEAVPLDPARLGCPVPRPRQVFGIGLNYRDHAAEASMDTAEKPLVFTKFPSSITGPYDTVRLPSDTVDFEVELVVVIGRHAYEIALDDAWSAVAGLTAGQDLSERRVQFAPPKPPQFNLSKSFPGFAPIGPAVVTPDELDDPDDLELSCTLSGQQMQRARTRDLIFSVPSLVQYLSSMLPLWPGDLIFTGTPAGIGWVREPRRMITTDDELVTSIEGIGEMRHRFVSNAS